MRLPSYLESSLEPLALMVQDRLAVIGGVVLLAIIAMALFAPLIATHDPRLINEIEDGSVLVRGEEAVWRLEPSLGPFALSGADSFGDQALVVGRAGTAFLRRDGRWAELRTGTTADLLDTAFGPDGSALVVGHGGTVLLVDGQRWQPIATPAPVELRGVAWIDDTSALIVGTGETLWRLDLAPSPVIRELASPVGRGFPLNAVARDADGTLLAVGDRGLALRYDPTSDQLALERLGTTRELNGLHITAAGTALAVGERGTLLRRAAGTTRWIADDAPDTRALRAGWIDDTGRALAVGRNGVILERAGEGEGWIRAETESERHLRTLFVLQGTMVALGSDLFVNRLLRALPFR
ncbi:MAG: hypothetical protein EA356_00800 [Geminicoccaceae bacterium]|nr:MAG: hypothetical protein EA356_00800 [Geminicoccaceae bacterium]